jgi:tetratricopeptide (TPR) repeat protein
VQATKVIDSNPFKAFSLSIIAQSLARSNRLDESQRLFDEAIKVANAIDDNYDKSEALSSIAYSLAQSNRFDQAIKVANAIDDNYDKSEALSSIAYSLAQSKRFDQAIKVANAIDGNYQKLDALSSIAYSLAQSKRFDESQRLFDEAIQISKSIDDDKKSTILSKIIVDRLQIMDSNSRKMMESIVTHLEDGLYEISISPLKDRELGNYIMRQCIGYSENTYIVCSLVAERYPEDGREIADLMLRYNL